MDTFTRILHSGGKLTASMAIDRMTLLLFAPRLSLWGEESRGNESYCKEMSYLVENLLSDRFDPDFVQGKPSDLFKYHYHLKDDIDIQFGSVLPRRKKIDSSIVALTVGIDSDTLPETFSYHPNDYSFRIEYNPSKTSLQTISDFLRFFSSRLTLDLVKVARIDIAIDYPFSVNPCLCCCSRICKSFIAIGSQGVETVYFGSRNSAHYVRLYDKRTELLEKQNIKIDTPLWRLELEYKRSFPLSSPPDLTSFYSRISFYSSGIKSDDWTFDMFLSYACSNGLKAALSSLPSSTRSRYMIRLKDYEDRFLEYPVDIYSRLFPSVYSSLLNDVIKSFGWSFYDGTVA